MLVNTKDILDDGEAIVTVLDVGQGLSSIVQTKNHTVVFDTGVGTGQLQQQRHLQFQLL